MQRPHKKYKNNSDQPHPEKAITLVGQGGFGCVYYRGFDTHGNLLSKRYITKITRREKTREIDIGKLVSNLPGYDAFFSSVIGVEDIDLGVIEKTLGPNVPTSCDIIKRYVGKSLDSAARPTETQFQILKEVYVPNVSMLDLVKTPADNVAKLLNTIISCHGHVLIGVRRLQDEVGVVHYDIKATNVVFNTIDKNPIIIDFGLSFLISDVRAALLLPDSESVVALKQFFYGYFPDYDAWPLEVHIISYIVSTTLHTAPADADHDREVAVLTVDALRNMVEQFIARHHFIIYQTREYINKFRARAVSYFTRVAVGRPGMEVIRELVADWKRWDFYSVAAMFLDMLEVIRETYSEPVLAPYASLINVFSASLQKDAKFV